MGWFPRIHRDKHGRMTLRCGGRKHYLGVDEAAAKAQAAELLEMYGYTSQEDRPRIVVQLIDQWLAEHPADRYAVEAWNDLAGTRYLAELTPDALYELARHLQQHGQSPATQRKYVNTTKRILHWAERNRWIKFHITSPRLPKPIRQARDLTPDQTSQLLACLRPAARRIVTFLLVTGARPGEACGLRWQNVDLARRACVLTDHKTALRTGRPRTIYLPRAALDILQQPGQRKGYVFLSSRGKPYTPAGLRSILSRHDVTPYQLRHTFAQAAIDQLPAVDVAKLLGHSDLRTIHQYVQVRDERARSAADSLSFEWTG